MNEQLEGCISRLQEMNDALQVCTQTLQTATQDFPRLRMVSALQRNYEFVTEKEMRAAKDQVADQVEPQMINLISKAEDILCALEKERDEIATKLNEPVHEEQATPSKRTPVAKPGAPKLIAIQRKKDALIRKATKLRKELQRKEREMNEAFEKSEQTDDKSMKDDDSTPETRQKNAGHYEELNEEYKLLAKALSNRQAALEAERALKAKQAEEAKVHSRLDS
ncbi:Spc19-domain-containing protein [Syncephalis plumigaleata]|nr:Spc19-domain-containing protein [Syncephalis plumigaleata]